MSSEEGATSGEKHVDVCRMLPAEYLQKHGIRDRVCTLIKELAVHQPSNPQEHLDAVLERVRRSPRASDDKTHHAAHQDAQESTTPVVARMAKFQQAREGWEAGKKSFYAWLSKTPEEALEPELEIVDPHHHLWDMRELPQGVNPFGIFKQKHYMLEELLEDCLGGGHNVTHTVYAEAHAFHSADCKDPVMAPLGEVVAVQGVAAMCASGKYGQIRVAAGIIGSADLAKFGAGIEPYLLACKASCPNFRGVRVTASHDTNLENGNFRPQPGLFLDEKFREGFEVVGKHGLVFDAWIFACQLPDLYDLATSFPNTTIVMDHIATPVGALGDNVRAPAYHGKQAEVVERWKVEMTRIARDCPNVYVKVGGNALPHLGHGFDCRASPPSSEEVALAFQDTYLWTIRTFGCERCMFEGNFPVDKVSGFRV